MAFPGPLALKGNLLREVEELAAQASLPEDSLRLRLQDYLDAARATLAQGSVQRQLAEGIALNSLELLSSQGEGVGRPLAQAAILYLLQTDDLISDFESPLGLYDDVEVFNAVALALMRPDLAVSEE